MKFDKFGYEIEMPAPEKKGNFTINNMPTVFSINSVKYEMVKRSQLMTILYINACETKEGFIKFIKSLDKK